MIAAGNSGAAPPRGRRLNALLAGLYRHSASALGTSIVVLFLTLALIGPLIAPFGLNEQIATDALAPPSGKHLFGTDLLGRDVFSRVILGARQVLELAGTGTLIAVLLGTSIGLFSGYRGGWLDELVMRFFDSLLSLPALLLALLLLGTLGPSQRSVLVVIAVVYTPIVARVVRSVALSVKTKGFIDAARLQGESLGRILFREIFPSALPTLAVEASLRFSYAIFLVASLGFLGIGVQPPSPDWGLMVKEARAYVSQAPWALYFPAGAIAMIVVGVNLMADGLKRELQASRE
ncbi:MAG: ABC transporter permease [Anaerolineales bacterium]|jgi:peptide/nickel transport system permease protein